MGGVIDEHQARLDSFVSCRCGNKSRVDVQPMEEDRRSELSYAEPTQAASPITVPSSALPTSSEEESTPTPAQPHYHPEGTEEWTPDQWSCCYAEGERIRRQREEELEDEAQAQGSPASESFFDGSTRNSPGNWGRLVEITEVEEEPVDRAEVMVLALFTFRIRLSLVFRMHLRLLVRSK